MTKSDMRPAETKWGKAIDWLIEKSGGSLGDLSRAIGKERSQIYNWRFKGKNGPTVENVAAILQATNCTWADWAAAMKVAEASEKKLPMVAQQGKGKIQQHKLQRDGPKRRKTDPEKYGQVS